MKSLSILVADDEPVVRELTQIWLKKAGHEVTCVTNAADARLQLQTHHFDVFVCDVRMPGADALQLIRDAGGRGAHLRVLAISGGGQLLKGGDCLKLAQDMGAHRVLVKPFTEAEFLDAVALALSATH